jgi:hypothetical protein
MSSIKLRQFVEFLEEQCKSLKRIAGPQVKINSDIHYTDRILAEEYHLLGCEAV